ncbi:MAG: hypothetical protein ACOX7U_03280 [Desulfitobacteriia bacterium]|jgi:hypothetical protein
MTKTIIKNIGQFVTGDINQPLLKADCIVIEGSQITYVGLESNLGMRVFRKNRQGSRFCRLPRQGIPLGGHRN